MRLCSDLCAGGPAERQAAAADRAGGGAREAREETLWEGDEPQWRAQDARGECSHAAGRGERGESSHTAGQGERFATLGHSACLARIGLSANKMN